MPNRPIEQPLDIHLRPVQAFKVARDHSVTVSGTTTHTTPLVESGLVRLVSTAGVYIQFIASGTPTSVNSDNLYLVANMPELFSVGDNTLFTALNATVAAKVSLSEVY